MVRLHIMWMRTPAVWALEILGPNAGRSGTGGIYRPPDDGEESRGAAQNR